VSKAKKKVAKKTAAKKARAVPAGARDVGFRESKLAEAVLRAEVDEVRASVDDEPAPVCAAFNCYEHVADYGDLCAKHAPSEPHVVSEPSTDDEIAASDNAFIRETHAKLSVRAPGHGSEDTDPSPSSDARHRPGAPPEPATPAYFPSEQTLTAEDMAGAVDTLAAMPVPTMADRKYEAPPERVLRAPEKHTYVPPEPAGRPTLPALHHALEFHTPPGRQGMYCHVAFALLPEAGVVVRRVLDRLAGTAAYAIAGVGDLDDVQYMEIGSHYWHDATDEECAAIAVRDFETDLRRIAEQAGPVAEAFAEKLLAAEVPS